jgi:hypothetical protein
MPRVDRQKMYHRSRAVVDCADETHRFCVYLRNKKDGRTAARHAPHRFDTLDFRKKKLIIAF